MIPSPGSEEARTAGCRCPVMDNGHGRGYMGGMRDESGELVFAISGDCAMHWPGTKSARELAGSQDSGSGGQAVD